MQLKRFFHIKKKSDETVSHESCFNENKSRDEGRRASRLYWLSRSSKEFFKAHQRSASAATIGSCPQEVPLVSSPPLKVQETEDVSGDHCIWYPRFPSLRRRASLCSSSPSMTSSSSSGKGTRRSSRRTISQSFSWIQLGTPTYFSRRSRTVSLDSAVTLTPLSASFQVNQQHPPISPTKHGNFTRLSHISLEHYSFPSPSMRTTNLNPKYIRTPSPTSYSQPAFSINVTVSNSSSTVDCTVWEKPSQDLLSVEYPLYGGERKGSMASIITCSSTASSCIESVLGLFPSVPPKRMSATTDLWLAAVVQEESLRAGYAARRRRRYGF